MYCELLHEHFNQNGHNSKADLNKHCLMFLKVGLPKTISVLLVVITMYLHNSGVSC